MPKKTKKEKIIAEYRRRLQSATIHPSDKTYSTQIFPKSVQANTYRLRQFDQHPIAQGIAFPTSDDFPAIRHDLIKTIIFAAFAVAIEFVLYLRIGK